MKIALEKGESLEVALTENGQVTGYLSLTISGLAKSSAVAVKAASAAPAAGKGGRGAKATKTGKTRKARKPLSPEAKARMAEAQKRRWEAFRNKDAGNQG